MTVLAELVPRDRLLTKAKNGVISKDPTARVIKAAGKDFPPSDLNLVREGRSGLCPATSEDWIALNPDRKTLEKPLIMLNIGLS
jgi:hypothetical protein